MNICIVCDHYPLPPRAAKMRDSIMKLNNSFNVHFFVWNREGVVVKEEYVKSLNDSIGYGNQYKKLIYLIKFLFALKRHLNMNTIDVLHGIDFEMAFVCSLLKKNQKLIYEVYDIKFFDNQWMNNIRIFLEKGMMRKVNGMIYASPFFSQYYQSNHYLNYEGIVINNKPLKSSVSYVETETLKKYTTIGFIGVLRYKEILINLIEAMSSLQSFDLLLAGSGPDEDYLRQNVSSRGLDSRVTFTGRFDLSQLAHLYSQCDLIWAAYPNKDTNVYYAVSNKFFESIAFGKKVVVSKDTLLAQWVSDENLGYTVDPYDKKAIFDLLSSFKKNESKQLSAISNLFWEDEENRLKEIYSF